LIVNEASLVDRPANDLARVLLWKRAPEEVDKGEPSGHPFRGNQYGPSGGGGFGGVGTKPRAARTEEEVGRWEGSGGSAFVVKGNSRSGYYVERNDPDGRKVEVSQVFPPGALETAVGHARTEAEVDKRTGGARRPQLEHEVWRQSVAAALERNRPYHVTQMHHLGFAKQQPDAADVHVDSPLGAIKMVRYADGSYNVHRGGRRVSGPYKTRKAASDDVAKGEASGHPFRGNQYGGGGGGGGKESLVSGGASAGKGPFTYRSGHDIMRDEAGQHRMRVMNGAIEIFSGPKAATPEEAERAGIAQMHKENPGLARNMGYPKPFASMSGSEHRAAADTHRKAAEALGAKGHAMTTEEHDQRANHMIQQMRHSRAARVSKVADHNQRREILKALADHEHPFSYCMANVAPKADVDDPEAFCANLVHEATGHWPGRAKKGLTMAKAAGNTSRTEGTATPTDDKRAGTSPEENRGGDTNAVTDREAKDDGSQDRKADGGGEQDRAGSPTGDITDYNPDFDIGICNEDGTWYLVDSDGGHKGGPFSDKEAALSALQSKVKKAMSETCPECGSTDIQDGTCQDCGYKMVQKGEDEGQQPEAERPSEAAAALAELVEAHAQLGEEIGKGGSRLRMRKLKDVHRAVGDMIRQHDPTFTGGLPMTDVEKKALDEIEKAKATPSDVEKAKPKKGVNPFATAADKEDMADKGADEDMEKRISEIEKSDPELALILKRSEERVAKAEKRAAGAEEIAKEERDLRVAMELTSVAKRDLSGLPGTVEEKVTRLQKLYAHLPKADADAEVAEMRKAATAIRQSAAFREVGSAGEGGAPAADAATQIDNLAKARQSEVNKSAAPGQALTYAKAYGAIIAENPDLYAQYKREMSERSQRMN
jgi:hypothetical protein